MKLLRKIGLWLTALTACVAVCGLSACDGDGEPTPPPATLSLDKTEVGMLIGDETSIKATYSEVAGATLAYSSADDDVASVSQDGTVIALSRGETTISVSYGELTKTCNVTVGLGDETPLLSFTQLTDSEVTVMRTDTLNFASVVTFNEKTFTDAQVDYTLSDPTVASIQNGILTPLKVGETTVTATANWRGETGATLEKSVLVTVKDDVNLYVNDGLEREFTLYTTDSFAGNTFQKTTEFVGKAVVNGVDTACVVTPLDDALDFVTYEDNALVAKAAGVAKFELSCTVDGNEYTQEITVTVILPVADYATPVNFSCADGALPLETIFGGAVTLDKAFADGEPLVLEGNLIKGLTADNAEVAEKKISVYTATCGYNVTLKLYTKIIDDANDLTVFDLATATTVIEGQYLLADDLDASSVAPKMEHRGYAAGGGSNSSFVTTATVGFKGTFDGNGKTLKLQVGCMGLFGKLLDGAVIKNLSLEATHTTKTHAKLTSSVLAHTLEEKTTGNGVKIENCYVKVLKTVTTSYNTSIIGTRVSMLYMTNVVVDNQTIDESKNGGALFYADGTRNYVNAGNNLALDKVNAKLVNVYVVSGSNYMAKWGAATVADGVTTVKAILANNVDRTNYTLTDNSTFAYTGVNVYAGYVALAAAWQNTMPWTVDSVNNTLIWKN